MPFGFSTEHQLTGSNHNLGSVLLYSTSEISLAVNCSNVSVHLQNITTSGITLTLVKY